MCFREDDGKWQLCSCPNFLVLEDLPINGANSTPLDRLGYQPKCCGCIPLKMAAVFIFFVSLFWALCELHKVDKFVSNIFPEKNKTSHYFKLFYIMWTMLYLLVIGIFMLGILVNKYHLVNLYVWFSFAYVCVYFGSTATGIVMPVWKNGAIEKKQVNSIVFAVFWTCFYIYFLIVVNSYKLTLWLSY
ncbi:hypothetical protein O3G_MSEX013955 [Manduca sexta]|uniref:Uncharacterized protein n=2 Tax=Manduca sexta TaxID=7130 RepID=A0A921ZT08_MANSE|nr:hypothetical protein O3G_MSEX013955 [Manduca sexta]